MTNEEINKKCCKILGIHWHERLLFPYRKCSCGDYDCQEYNPNFCDDAGAVRLLRELIVSKPDFVKKIFSIDDVDYRSYDPELLRWVFIGFVEYITTPGRLATKLIEWKEGKE